jgi:O-antigen/teichoic acid export membrane protein
MSDISTESAAANIDPVSQLETVRSWRVLLGNFATLAVGEGVARLFSLVAVLLMARRLGPDSFGVIIFGLALTGWFAMLQDSGTELLNVREVSRRPDDFRPIAERVLGLRLALSIGAMVIFAGLVVALAKAPIHRETLLGFTFLLPALALNLRWMVLGVGAARAVAVGNVAARLTFVVTILLFVAGPHDVTRVPYLLAVAELTYALVVLAVVWQRYGVFRPRVDLAAWRETLGASYPIMVTGFSRGVIAWFDVFLIGIVLLPGDVGIYGAAEKPVLFASTALGLLSLSFLSAYSAAAPEVATQLLRKTLRVALAVTLAAAIFLSATSSELIPLLFGDRFSGGTTVLAILTWTIPLAALSTPFSVVLIAHDHQRVLMRNTLVVAGAVIASVGVAVPLGGIDAAAAAGVATSALAVVLNYRSAASRGFAPPLGELVGRAPGPAAETSGRT